MRAHFYVIQQRKYFFWPTAFIVFVISPSSSQLIDVSVCIHIFSSGSHQVARSKAETKLALAETGAKLTICVYPVKGESFKICTKHSLSNELCTTSICQLRHCAYHALKDVSTKSDG